MEEILGIVVLVGLVWFCGTYYWARVVAISVMMLFWVLGPIAGWIYGITQACSVRLGATCLFQSIGGAICIAVLGIFWWMAFSACRKWMREHPPSNYGLTDEV